jgi:predicted transcriptional regulator
MKKDISFVDQTTGEILNDGDYVAMIVPVKRHNGFSKGWVAMSQEAILKASAELNSLQDHKVFLTLLGMLDFENLIQVAQADIAEKLNMRKPHVSRSIKNLKELGILLEGPKIGRSKTYRLNPTYGWKGSAKNHNQALKDMMNQRNISVIDGGKAPVN